MPEMTDVTDGDGMGDRWDVHALTDGDVPKMSTNYIDTLKRTRCSISISAPLDFR